MFHREDPTSLPSHWCEIFVGNLPKTATDADVRALCETVGPVHTINLIPDSANPGQNKGFGFVRFTTKKAAAVALETLPGKQLAGHAGRQVRVSPSQSKHKVFLGNVPREAVRTELEDKIREVTKGIVVIG